MINNKKFYVSLLIAGYALMLISCNNTKYNQEILQSSPTGKEEEQGVLQNSQTGETGEEKGIQQSTQDESREADGQVSAGQTELITEHEGIYVYTGQDTDEDRSKWYPDVDSFLREFDFEKMPPFYEYYNIDGNLQMTLYYDEQAGKDQLSKVNR